MENMKSRYIRHLLVAMFYQNKNDKQIATINNKL